MMAEIRVRAGSRSVGTGAKRDRQELANAESKRKKARREPGLNACMYQTATLLPVPMVHAKFLAVKPKGADVPKNTDYPWQINGL